MKPTPKETVEAAFDIELKESRPLGGLGIS